MKKLTTRELTAIAMLIAVSWVLYMFNFKIPIVPSFLSMDFSELPAVIASLSMGPAAGVLVCLVKNLLHLLISQTLWIGELSNFILGAAFVAPIGFIYRRHKTKKNAVIAMLAGAVSMCVVGLFSNYFLIYPLYGKFAIPMEVIVGMYSAILPAADTLFKALVIFNVPFTFVKAMVSVVVTFFVYKPLSNVIKNVGK